MTQLIKSEGVPSLLSDFFDDDPFFSYDLNKVMWPRLGNGFLTRIPAANVKETDKEFTIELGVPGMEKKDFHVEVENGFLCISSEKKEEKKETKKGFSKQEFSYNSFSRSFKLPEFVEQDKIKAHYENGVLKVAVPKKDGAKKLSKKVVKIV